MTFDYLIGWLWQTERERMSIIFRSFDDDSEADPNIPGFYGTFTESNGEYSIDSFLDDKCTIALGTNIKTTLSM